LATLSGNERRIVVGIVNVHLKIKANHKGKLNRLDIKETRTLGM
jgi:hypothetical protein